MDRFLGALDRCSAGSEADAAKRTNILASPAVMSMWGGVYVAGQPVAEFRIAGRTLCAREYLFLLVRSKPDDPGVAFAIWARVFLGGNWSSAVTIKADHELVRNGPYALVRHPIYSGTLLALLGTSIVFHAMRGLLAFGVAFLALRIKSRREEVFMMQEFGAEYVGYMKTVKALIPFVW